MRFRKYWKQTARIEKLIKKYEQLSDAELQAKTADFQAQISHGQSLDNILPDAYAVVCVVDERVLRMRPYRVQIFGAVAMQDSNIIEMKTGEGKTLTATMIMYLHGLTGPGNFLVTANSYLAKRDAESMGKVYRFLGLTVANNRSSSDSSQELSLKKKIYASDIVYTDSGSLGFDYLFNNLASNSDKQFIRAFKFALIDEVDTVLLDLAATPLVISGTPKANSNYNQLADIFVKTLKEKQDYALSKDRKKVWFLKQGLQRANRFFGVTDVLAEEQQELYRHLLLALRANYVLRKNQDYIIAEGKIVLIDENNGRKLPGMQLQAGQHQALEVKEGLKETHEQSAVATITYQNLYRMFTNLAGMTGTASGDKRELMQIYNLYVVKVPTNKKSIRKDFSDLLYYTTEAKLHDSLTLVEDSYAKKRPVLVETGSLALSEQYSKLLLQRHVPHSLLNAESAAKEAEIIKSAGQVGMVTVSTSMAGRGTDIVLSPEAQKLGGLLVIGTERMSLRRIDNQLRGRSGRQGEPGATIFFTSLEDKIIKQFPSANIDRLIAKHRHDSQLIRFRFRHLFTKLQTRIKHQEQEARFNTLQYGEVMKLQRDAVYQARNRLMTSAVDLDQVVINSATAAIADLTRQPITDINLVTTYIVTNLDPTFLGKLNRRFIGENLADNLTKLFERQFAAKRTCFESEEAWTYFEQTAILKAIDDSWVKQVDNLEQLQAAVQQHVIGQQDSLFDYQQEALAGFNAMKKDISLKIMRYLLCSKVTGSTDKGMQIYFA
ncbi:preprotein translocase subunit SecA [Lactobacillus sp. ESL0785]|uniref:preprotein translocase subunit SecA n=1 Tax=Lactobacillus sp. ESL0785 TaxID=2983232 RepID=UPI0023F9B957|nr:preprotein translocase subunit SecA [Lactobacillus sp. ESL0785]WEV71429.1 preprotein translocase subunit SecA [Lactobacillus sp. ESL0785]